MINEQLYANDLVLMSETMKYLKEFGQYQKNKVMVTGSQKLFKRKIDQGGVAEGE